jgi:hypothetical protein
MKLKTILLSIAPVGLPLIALLAADQHSSVQELAEFVITATREPEPLFRKPPPPSASSLRSHSGGSPHLHIPRQILSQVPGVGVSVTNGEGHTRRHPSTLHHQPAVPVSGGRHRRASDRILQPQFPRPS